VPFDNPLNYVSVLFCFKSKEKKVEPLKFYLNGKEYKVSKIGLHHTFKKGEVLFHVFSVLCGDSFFKLILNSKNLFWTVEYDGI